MARVDPPSGRVDVRKYPNRRYYDATRSRHVTLEEIYHMVRNGSDVHVTDSKSGDDITTQVLAQIILEHDAPKLAIFPVELLHQLIRANEPLIRDFVDKYFNQALAMFLESQRQFDRYLRQSLGLQSPLPSGEDWARMIMGPFSRMFLAASQRAGNGHVAAEESASAVNELRAQLIELRGQVALLKAELDRSQGLETDRTPVTRE
jgi:polyhydroxyalkanoate synthesis repressor PhaR